MIGMNVDPAQIARRPRRGIDGTGFLLALR
jgi:hypothetical protein